jgi:uncharacterized protein YecT (DUF1311 family)
MNALGAPCRGPASTLEATNCFTAAAKSADQQLNRTYEQIRNTLVDGDKKKLQEAQRIWLQFRDANCTAERELYSGGSAASMVYAACIEADTRHRTSELKTMYEWKVDK